MNSEKKYRPEYQEELDQLKNEAPILMGMKKDEGYKVPANYFADLPLEVKAKIDAMPKKQGSIIERLMGLWMRPQLAMGIAASFCLIFAVYFFVQDPTSPTSPVTADDFSIEEAGDYMALILDDITDEDIMDDALFIALDIDNELLNESVDMSDEDAFEDILLDDLDDQMLQETIL